jgi:hypothetical protein
VGITLGVRMPTRSDYIEILLTEIATSSILIDGKSNHECPETVTIELHIIEKFRHMSTTC